jgi:hypothetical protein
LLFDDEDGNDSEEEKKDGDPGSKRARKSSGGVLSSAEKGTARARVGISNDDDELLLDNYFVKVNEVFNPDGDQQTEETKQMMVKAH